MKEKERSENEKQQQQQLRTKGIYNNSIFLLCFFDNFYTFGLCCCVLSKKFSAATKVCQRLKLLCLSSLYVSIFYQEIKKRQFKPDESSVKQFLVKCFITKCPLGKFTSGLLFTCSLVLIFHL